MSEKSITSTNPYTGEKVVTYELFTDNQLDQILDQQVKAFTDYQKTTLFRRSEWMREAAKILRKNRAQYAKTITEEMGKLYRESLSEIDKCAWVCEYYAEQTPTFLANREIETDAQRSFVSYRPLGTILAIMPWNFPFWQVFRFAAPALMAGNTGLLKHASNVSKCSLLIEEVFREAGFPEHVFRSLIVQIETVADLVADQRIKAVTLTGGSAAGRAVASLAGKHLKKVVLELGGSDPYLVFADADLAKAARICAQARMLNAGQSCIGAKRFIVEENVYSEFMEAFASAMVNFRMGDPMLDQTTLAPLARSQYRTELHDQVMSSLHSGCKLALGGFLPQDGLSDCFYPPTVLTDITKESAAYREEFFGPVASVFRAKDENEAVRIANDSRFGLGAAVFTQDLERGLRIANEELEAGSCFVNAQVKSDPRLPFGGIKESGFGRELSEEGIKEFVNIKTVYIGAD